MAFGSSAAADLLFRTKWDGNEADRGVRKLRDGVDDLGDRMKDIDRRRITPRVDTRYVTGATRHVNTLTSSVRSFVRTAATIAVPVGGIALLGWLGKMGFGYANMQEQARIAFTTMLGDGKKAVAFMKELEQFAKETPFEMEGLVSGSQRLLAMGFSAKEILPTLRAVGDATAGLGGDPQVLERVITAMGQIRAKGKATGEEMMQLTESGIGAWDMLADKLGTTVPEAMDKVSKGQVSAETTILALTEGMSKQFDGMMEKQSKTTTGLWSTFMDNIRSVSGSVMEGFLPVVKDTLGGINAWFDDPKNVKGIVTFGKSVGEVVLDAVAVFQTYWPYAAQAVGGFIQLIGAAWPTVNQMFSSTVDFIRSNWPTVNNAFEGTKRAAADVWPYVKGIIDVVLTFIREDVLPGMKVLMSDLSGLWERHGGHVKEALRIVKDTLQAALNVIAGVVQFVHGILTGDWDQAWEGAKRAVGGAITWIKQRLIDLPVLVLKVVGTAGKAIGSNLLKMIMDGFKAFPSYFGKAIEAAVRAVPGLIGDAASWVGGKIRDRIIDSITPSIGLPGLGSWRIPGLPGGATGGYVGRTTGGVATGKYTGRDDRMIAVGGGEVVLRPDQANLVGLTRILSVLGRTGGRMITKAGATGGVVKAAYDRAVGKLGTAYSYGRWDCSDFAYYAAGMSPWGSTADAAGKDSVPARGNEPVMWGLRKSHSGSGWIGGPKEHMGIGILGPDGRRRWFDNGSGGVESNADSTRWSLYRVPKNWAGVNATYGSDTGTNTSGASTKKSPDTFAQLIGKATSGAIGSPGDIRSGDGKNPFLNVMSAGDVIAAYKGAVPDLSAARSTSPSGSASRAIDLAGRNARAAARQQGLSANDVVAAGDKAETEATKNWYRREIKATRAVVSKLVTRKKALLKAVQSLRREPTKNPGAKKKAIRSLLVRIKQVTDEIVELREIEAELTNSLGEVLDREAQDAYQDAEYASQQGATGGAETDPAIVEAQRLLQEQSQRVAERTAAQAAAQGAFLGALAHDARAGGDTVNITVNGGLVHEQEVGVWVTRALGLTPYRSRTAYTV